MPGEAQVATPLHRCWCLLCLLCLMTACEVRRGYIAQFRRRTLQKQSEPRHAASTRGLLFLSLLLFFSLCGRGRMMHAPYIGHV